MEAINKHFLYPRKKIILYWLLLAFYINIISIFLVCGSVDSYPNLGHITTCQCGLFSYLFLISIFGITKLHRINVNTIIILFFQFLLLYILTCTLFYLYSKYIKVKITQSLKMLIIIISIVMFLITPFIICHPTMYTIPYENYIGKQLGKKGEFELCSKMKENRRIYDKCMSEFVKNVNSRNDCEQIKGDDINAILLREQCYLNLAEP